MEEMNYEDWKKQTEKEEHGKEFEFEIKCKKCNSKKVIIDKENNRGYSEYTGAWGDAKAVIKCLECGNAFGIVVVEE